MPRLKKKVKVVKKKVNKKVPKSANEENKIKTFFFNFIIDYQKSFFLYYQILRISFSSFSFFFCMIICLFLFLCTISRRIVYLKLNNSNNNRNINETK